MSKVRIITIPGDFEGVSAWEEGDHVEVRLKPLYGEGAPLAVQVHGFYETDEAFNAALAKAIEDARGSA